MEGTVDGDRARGLLLGLAAGDRNGGPVQMALVLAEQLGSQGRYDPASIFAGYDAWWDGGKGVDAWDTGPTACDLFQQHRKDLQAGMAISDRLLEERSRLLDQRLHGMTAGVNAAHRIPPLALASFIGDESLVAIASQESRLTHWSPISQWTSAIVAMLCRYLVCGASWDSAIAAVLAYDGSSAPELRLVLESIRLGLGDEPVGKGGFCPEVLAASVRFLSHARSFDATLREALAFAGPDNYCPVLVGAIAGALFGASEIPVAHLQHCRPGVCDRCVSAADALLALSQGSEPNG